MGLMALSAALGYRLHPAAPPQNPPTPAPAPAPTPSAPAAQTTPALDAKSTLILELFNPSDASLTHQLGETQLRQQVEQILTSSFVLTKCDLITYDDYRDTFRALIAYTQASKLAPDSVAAEAIVRQIAESASASYSLIYSRTKCDDPQLTKITEQLLTWQKAYLK